VSIRSTIDSARYRGTSYLGARYRGTSYRGAAIHLVAIDPDTATDATRVDEIWGSVVRRSGAVAGSVSLLLTGVGILLLDMAVKHYPLSAVIDLLR
jgi:hypothetical protein